ncbi:hypothetical protein [Haloarcula litorea]|uniref:hypothetical protein n=1 Tax=Haloarcula litorea TaxID=3032579 RepID=UPI0023E79C3A|nr:hypothetical protein [Halomicroarcula sp. GDY20]
MDWVNRAGDLLYDGEGVQEQVRVGDGGVVVTSHRVLAFTPDREGPNYRAVERPNVEGVGLTTDGETDHLERGVKALVAGLALVAAGYTVDLDGLVSGVSLSDTAATGAAGLGRMLGTLQTLLGLLARLDDLLLLFGALALLFAVVVLGVYLWSRERVLVVEVAGDDDVHLPAPESGGDAVRDRLWAAIVPGDAPADAGRSPPADDPLA